MVSERLGWREKIRILTPLAKDRDGGTEESLGKGEEKEEREENEEEGKEKGGGVEKKELLKFVVKTRRRTSKRFMAST